VITTLLEFLLDRVNEDIAHALEVLDDAAPGSSEAHLASRLLAYAQTRRDALENRQSTSPDLAPGNLPESERMWLAGRDEQERLMLRTMSTAYLKHPDYRNEWLP
jgi:hypothetical protein